MSSWVCPNFMCISQSDFDVWDLSFIFKDCIAKIHQADNFYDKFLFLLTLSFRYSSDYFLWVNYVYIWVNQCMYSFHHGNIPESEFNSRPPVMLSQGPLWDWVSPAQPGEQNYCAATFHQFCVALSLPADDFYSVSFSVGEFLPRYQCIIVTLQG